MNIPARNPSRLRPRTGSSNALMETARERIEKLDDRSREVNARIDPLETEKLIQVELRARMRVGRARREKEPLPRVLLALLDWGLARLSRLRFMRALNLFFFHYGTVMAAGVAYMMFFSIAAILFSGFAVAGLVIGNDPDAQEVIIRGVNNAVPGVLGEGGLVENPEGLFDTGGLNLTLTLTVILAVVTSLSWMHGLRSGIRSIWERPLMAENVVLVKLRDLGVMLVIVTVVVTSGALGLVSGVFIDDAFEFLGWQADGLASRLTRAASLVISFGLDMVLAVLLMRVASRLVMPVSALWQSALIAGIGASLLRLGSTTLLQNYGEGEMANPIVASGGVVLGLFFYFFLFGIVYLIAASWGAVAARDHAERSD